MESESKKVVTNKTKITFCDKISSSLGEKHPILPLLKRRVDEFVSKEGTIDELKDKIWDDVFDNIPKLNCAFQKNRAEKLLDEIITI